MTVGKPASHGDLLRLHIAHDRCRRQILIRGLSSSKEKDLTSEELWKAVKHCSGVSTGWGLPLGHPSSYSSFSWTFGETFHFFCCKQDLTFKSWKVAVHGVMRLTSHCSSLASTKEAAPLSQPMSVMFFSLNHSFLRPSARMPGVSSMTCDGKWPGIVT